MTTKIIPKKSHPHNPDPHPSPSSVQNTQVQLLLQTNKILINNKKSIYQAKITTYEKQIQKIKAILGNTGSWRTSRQGSDDEEQQSDNGPNDSHDDDNNNDEEDQAQQEKASLLEKLAQIKSKKEEALTKLEAIDRIEQDIKLQESHKINIPANEEDKDKDKKFASTNINILNGKQNNFIAHPLNNTTKTTSNNHTNAQQWRIRQKQNKKSHQIQIYKPNPKKKNPKIYSIEKSIASIEKSKSSLNKYMIIEPRWKEERDGDGEQQWESNGKIINEFNMTGKCENGRSSQKKYRNRKSFSSSTPISIAREISKEKQLQKQRQRSRQHNEEVSSNILAQQQLAIILQQLENIIDTINQSQSSNDNTKPLQKFSNPNPSTIFKTSIENLLTIKSHITSTSKTISTLTQSLTSYKTLESEHQNRIQKLQLQEKQLKNIINKLKDQEGKVSEELLAIQKECQGYCEKIQERQKEYKGIGKKIEEAQAFRMEIQKNLGDIVRVYESNIGEMDKQLTEICQAISITQRQSSTRRPPTKSLDKKHKSATTPSLPQQSSLQSHSTSITQKYEQIRSSIQTQKLTILQNKQLILSLEYQIGLLKNQEKRLEGKNQDMLNGLEKMQAEGDEITREIGRLGKERERIGGVVEGLGREIQEYENLVAIKKRNYQQLDTKYTTLKTKKTKIQKSLKTLQSQLQSQTHNSTKLEQYTQKRQSILESINQEIHSKLRQKQQIIKEIQDIQTLSIEKNDSKKKIQEKLVKREEQLRKIETKLVEVQGNVQKSREIQEKKKGNIEKLEAEIKQIENSYIEKYNQLQKITSQLKSTQQSLSSTRTNLNNLTHQLSQSHSQLTHQQQTHSQLTQKTHQLHSQITNLSNVKEELEEALGTLLNKKEDAIGYLSGKYEELQGLEAEVQKLVAQGQELGSARERAIKEIQDLETEIQRLVEEKANLSQSIGKNSTKLQNLLTEIQQNRDQQQNLFARLQKLKQLSQKLLLQIAVLTFTPHPNLQQPYSLSTLLPLQTKHQIELQLEELKESKNIKIILEKEKQNNRKLKLDNQRLKKLVEMEMNVQGESDVKRTNNNGNNSRNSMEIYRNQLG